jgi:hypothetical protein
METRKLFTRNSNSREVNSIILFESGSIDKIKGDHTISLKEKAKKRIYQAR